MVLDQVELGAIANSKLTLVNYTLSKNENNPSHFYMNGVLLAEEIKQATIALLTHVSGIQLFGIISQDRKSKIS